MRSVDKIQVSGMENQEETYRHSTSIISNGMYGSVDGEWDMILL